MNPAKLAELLGYLALVPTAIPIAMDVINTVRSMINNGEEVTDDVITALVDEAVRNHAALPTPESIFKRS